MAFEPFERWNSPSITHLANFRSPNPPTSFSDEPFFVNFPPLAIATAAAPGGMVNQSYTFAVSASGGSGNFMWSAGGVPGLQINPQTGLVTGTPASPGTFTLSVVVTDLATNLTASATFTVTISPLPVSITTTSLPNGAAGVTYPSVTLTAKGGFGTYIWSASGVPPGITVSSAGVVGGTPASGGTFSAFTVTATDKTSKQTARPTGP